MRKRDELADPNSCLNRATDYERLFVLLGRDLDTPDTIRFWVGRRLLRGKNRLQDPEIQDALLQALSIEEQHKADLKHRPP